MQKVLVIDDQPAVRRALEVLFQLHDLPCITAGSQRGWWSPSAPASCTGCRRSSPRSKNGWRICATFSRATPGSRGCLRRAKNSVEWRPFLTALRGRFDPAQLQQVLINLLKNAHEASAGQPVAMRILADVQGGTLRLESRPGGGTTVSCWLPPG